MRRAWASSKATRRISLPLEPIAAIGHIHQPIAEQVGARFDAVSTEVATCWVTCLQLDAKALDNRSLMEHVAGVKQTAFTLLVAALYPARCNSLLPPVKKLG